MSAKKNHIQLMNKALELLNDIYGVDSQSSPIYNNIRKNLFNIHSWLPKNGSLDESNLKHNAAFKSLENAVIILSAIRQCSSGYEVVNAASISGCLVDNIFQGGHVLLEDNGVFFDILKESAVLFQRYSSHYHRDKLKALMNKGMSQSEAEQLVKDSKIDFSLRAEIVFREMLINKVEKDGKIFTWFQMEGHSHAPRTTYKNVLLNMLDWVLQCFNYNIEKLGHHKDWLCFVWSGRNKNIGQYGVSEYTEHAPIKMKPIV